MEIVNDIEVNDPEVVIPDSSIYSPAKQYTWGPDTVFELTGKEFGLWLNTIRGIVSTKEAIQLRMALECNNVIEDIMIREVAAGKIIEVVNPNKEQS